MDFETLADTLKALADPTRLRIVSLLNLRDFCVCELVPVFGISQPAVSKHMSRLRAAGIVTESRRGMWVFYSLNQTRLAEVGVSLTNLPDMTSTLNHLDEKGLLVHCDGVVTGRL